MHAEGFFVVPNAWDAGSAARLTRLGFRAIASTSAGASWAGGKEDGELSRDGALAHLRLLVASTDLPVNADFENGFADAPEQVAANVALAVSTGVSALSIEDWSGSVIYDFELAVDRIRAARQAIDAIDPSVMLIGRNENFRSSEMMVAESVKRATAYAEAGADCLFVPHIADEGAIAELVAAVAPKPLNVLVRSYDQTIRKLARLGVRRVSVGGSLARRSWQAFDTAADQLRQLEIATGGDARRDDGEDSNPEALAAASRYSPPGRNPASVTENAGTDRRSTPKQRQLLFSMSFDAQPTDIDEQGHVNNTVWVRWVQQITVAHWEALVPLERRAAFGWIVLRHDIEYRDNVAKGDTVIGRTWIDAAKGARLHRRVRFEDSDGRVIVEATSAWGCVARRSGRLTRIPPDVSALYLA